MKLYTHPISSNARRVRLVAHHLDLAIEEHQVDLSTGAHRRPDYLAINPLGKVPTLVDETLTLTESYAIMVYLCDKHSDYRLYPQALLPRTEVNRWLFWCASEWGPGVGRFNIENMVKPMLGGAPDPQRLQEAEALFKPLATHLDARLSTQSYVAGEALSLADFALVAGLATASVSKVPIDGYVHIARWFTALQSLPAWTATSALR